MSPKRHAAQCSLHACAAFLLLALGFSPPLVSAQSRDQSRADERIEQRASEARSTSPSEIDPLDNPTQLTDNSGSGAAKSATFTYNDLHRLLSPSTTAASSTPYLESYAYNALGNFTSKTGQGSYTYAGTNYANPHAPTTVGSVTQTYDNNGNLTNAMSARNGTMAQAIDYLPYGP